MVNPDGNRVRLVRPGHDRISQLATAMGVRSLSEHRRFYGDGLGFAEQPGRAVWLFAWGPASFSWRQPQPKPSIRLVKPPARAPSPCTPPVSAPTLTISISRRF